MKHIFEYLFSKKSDLDKIKINTVRPFDILDISGELYVYFTDELFEKIDSKFRDSLCESKKYIQDGYPGVFYMRSGDFAGWMSPADYDKNFNFIDKTYKYSKDWDIKKIYRLISKPDQDFFKKTFYNKRNINDLAKSDKYELIWARS